jgi:endoglucanase
MRLPHSDDLSNFAGFVTSLQGAVTAIRAAGATSQSILLPGNDWTHAASMISTSGPQLLTIKDTSSDSSKLLIDIHQYLDSDGSGTSTTCTTDSESPPLELAVFEPF